MFSRMVIVFCLTCLFATWAQASVPIQISLPPTQNVTKGGCSNIGYAPGGIEKGLTITFQPQGPPGQVTVNPSSITYRTSQDSANFNICALATATSTSVPLNLILSGPDSDRATLLTPTITINILDPKQILDQAMAAMGPRFGGSSTTAAAIANMFGLNGIPMSLPQGTSIPFTQPSILNNIPPTPIVIPSGGTTPLTLGTASNKLPFPQKPQITSQPSQTELIKLMNNNLEKMIPSPDSFPLTLQFSSATQNQVQINIDPKYNGTMYYMLRRSENLPTTIPKFSQVKSAIDDSTKPNVWEDGKTKSLRQNVIVSAKWVVSQNREGKQIVTVDRLWPSSTYVLCGYYEERATKIPSRGDCLRFTTLSANFQYGLFKFTNPIGLEQLNNLLCAICSSISQSPYTVMTDDGQICNRINGRFPQKYFYQSPVNRMYPTDRVIIFNLVEEKAPSQYFESFRWMFSSSAVGAPLKQSKMREFREFRISDLEYATYLGQINTERLFRMPSQVQLVNRVRTNNDTIFVDFSSSSANGNRYLYYSVVPQTYPRQTPEDIMGCTSQNYCGKILAYDSEKRQVSFPLKVPENFKFSYTTGPVNPTFPTFGVQSYEIPITRNQKYVGQPTQPKTKSGQTLFLSVVLLVIVMFMF